MLEASLWSSRSEGLLSLQAITEIATKLRDKVASEVLTKNSKIVLEEHMSKNSVKSINT